MRPGLVFVSLFAVLAAVYVLLGQTLGLVPTFIVQAAIVVALLAAAIRCRDRRAGHDAVATADGPEDSETRPAGSERS